MVYVVLRNRIVDQYYTETDVEAIFKTEELAKQYIEKESATLSFYGCDDEWFEIKEMLVQES